MDDTNPTPCEPCSVCGALATEPIPPGWALTRDHRGFLRFCPEHVGMSETFLPPKAGAKRVHREGEASHVELLTEHIAHLRESIYSGDTEVERLLARVATQHLLDSLTRAQEVLRLRAEVERLRSENEVLGRENAYLAPRLRAGQRIFAAVDKIDPKFTREASGTAVDPFQHDERCEAFLREWVMRMRDRRDGGEPIIPDPPCAGCGQGIACQEGCCASPGPDGVLCHNECAEVPRG